MKFSHSFKVKHNIKKCWSFFQNIDLLVQCIPGARLKEDCGDGKYIGEISVSLGPFKAKFEGEAIHNPDNINYSGILDGKALDKKGGSRTKISLSYFLISQETATEVKMDADIMLSGPIAQFGRVGVIQETAKLLIEQFVKNAENEMSDIRNNVLENQLKEIKNDESVSHASHKSFQKTTFEKVNRDKKNDSINIFKIIGILIKNYFFKKFKK